MAQPVLAPPPEGWAAFWNEHGDALLRAAVAVIGLHDHAGVDAEDVVSKVMTKLVARGIRTDRSAIGTVMTSVYNAAVDALRTAKRYTDGQIDLDTFIGIEDIEASVDLELLGKEAVAALDELPEREARAIRQKVMNDRPWREVAAEFDVTTSQGLGKIVNPGLAKLRKMPRFAELLPDVSSPQAPSTTTGSPRATTP